MNKLLREMSVPTRGHAGGDFDLRTHEMAHIKWSPDKPEEYEGVTPTALLGVEDARINHLLTRLDIGLDQSQPFTEAESMRLRQRIAGNPLEAASLVAASYYTADRDRFLDVTKGTLSAEKQQEIVAMLQEYEQHAEDFERYSVGLARWMTTHFKGVESRSASSSMCMAHGKGEPGDEGDEGDEPGEGGRRPGRGHGGRQVDPRTWGAMHIEEPPRVNPLPSHLRKRAKRASDTGITLSRVNRLLTDEKIFRVKGKRREGASLLIDVSGSMSLNSGDVMKIMEALPSSIVAMYWGTDDQGTLRILAKDGKTVSQPDIDNRDGQGNVVDGPALRWLATQAEPRVWICDGEVTGTDDVQTHELNEEAQQIVDSANIRRIHSVEDVLDELKTEGSL